MKIKISVTENDIRVGQKQHGSLCPVALATLRALDIRLDEILDFEVDGIEIHFWYDNIYYVARSNIVNGFVYNFDNRVPVIPFEAELYFKDMTPEPDYD